MTRGHNIVADAWAGASDPHPHPNPFPTLKHTQKVSKTLVFLLFNSMTTDQRTDGRTDKASYRVACPQLKIVKRRRKSDIKKRKNDYIIKRCTWLAFYGKLSNILTKLLKMATREKEEEKKKPRTKKRDMKTL